MSVNVVPPSVLTSHCTVGVGVPLAAAVNVAVATALTDAADGLVVTTGPVELPCAIVTFVV